MCVTAKENERAVIPFFFSDHVAIQDEQCLDPVNNERTCIKTSDSVKETAQIPQSQTQQIHVYAMTYINHIFFIYNPKINIHGPSLNSNCSSLYITKIFQSSFTIYTGHFWNKIKQTTHKKCQTARVPPPPWANH